MYQLNYQLTITDSGFAANIIENSARANQNDQPTLFIKYNR